MADQQGLRPVESFDEDDGAASVNEEFGGLYS
jgi:hypothetical protein